MKANQAFRNDNKAEVGIGTMIVFIATILVAAVAAGVLISTSNKLQNKSTQTGNDATQAVGTSLEVINVYGNIHTAANNIDYLSVWVQLADGSEPIDLTEVVLQLKTGSTTTLYDFESTATNLFEADTGEPAYGGSLDEEFRILTNDGSTGAGATARVLENGEVLVLRIGATSATIGTALNIGEDASATISLIPEQGLTTEVSFTTPETFSDDLAFELA